MSKNSGRLTRRPISLACAVVACGFTAATWADEAPVAKSTSAKKATVVVLTAAQALTVVRDPLSGVLRAPTDEERQALVPSAVAPAPGAGEPVAMQTKIHAATGARGVTLGESTLSYVVVRRNADGSLTESCVTGPEAAALAMKAPLTSKRELSRE